MADGHSDADELVVVARQVGAQETATTLILDLIRAAVLVGELAPRDLEAGLPAFYADVEERLAKVGGGWAETIEQLQRRLTELEKDS
jgi:hypothetical protein